MPPSKFTLPRLKLLLDAMLDTSSRDNRLRVLNRANSFLQAITEEDLPDPAAVLNVLQGYSLSALVRDDK